MHTHTQIVTSFFCVTQEDWGAVAWTAEPVLKFYNQSSIPLRLRQNLTVNLKLNDSSRSTHQETSEIHLSRPTSPQKSLGLQRAIVTPSFYTRAEGSNTGPHVCDAEDTSLTESSPQLHSRIFLSHEEKWNHDIFLGNEWTWKLLPSVKFPELRKANNMVFLSHKGS